MSLAKEYRDQSLEELELLVHEARGDLFKMRNKAKLEKPEKPHLFSAKKNEIAVLLTVIREKQGARS